MLGEEFLYIVPRVSCAEIARGFNEVSAHKRGEQGLNLIPVVLDESPPLIASGGKILSGVERTRIATPSSARAAHLKSPTRKASRCVDIFGVVVNLTVCLPSMGRGVSEAIGLLEMAVSPISTTSVTSKVALSAGSSKHRK